MTGLVMLGADGVVCEGDACVLPAAAQPGRADAETAAETSQTAPAGTGPERAQP